MSLLPGDPTHTNQEALELFTDIQATLLSTLRDLKHRPTLRPINDFRGYVATVTYNACHQLLRQKYPKRFQLKNKLRYLLNHEPAFALWENDGDWICGLAEWRGSRRSPVAAASVQKLRVDQQHSKNAHLANHQRQAFTDLLSKTFQTLNGAVLLDELVSVVADQLQIKEDLFVAEDESARSISNHTDSVMHLETQAELQKLWEEICALPLLHRTALLLNLRDRQGTDALELFHMTRVATIQDIAVLLDFTPAEFANVWRELPWDDLKIAKHLELTRQQVINLRQSARARLARRLKGLGESDTAGNIGRRSTSKIE